MNRKILLIFIAIFAVAAAAPLETQTSKADVSETNDSLDQWWTIFREKALHPVLQLITDSAKPEDPTFKSTSSDNSSENSLAVTNTTETTKIFGYLDDAVWEMWNLTTMGYVYMVILVILIISITICTCCCCCCCGCCRR